MVLMALAVVILLVFVSSSLGLTTLASGSILVKQNKIRRKSKDVVSRVVLEIHICVYSKFLSHDITIMSSLR